MLDVLIVEDEFYTLNALEKVVLDSGLNCRVVGKAVDGEEAVEMIRQHVPGLVLTDIRMPNMDGLELASYISTNYPQVDVVIISGYSDFSYAQQGIRYRVIDYLLKPIKREQLVQVIEQVIEKRSRGQITLKESWEPQVIDAFQGLVEKVRLLDRKGVRVTLDGLWQRLVVEPNLDRAGQLQVGMSLLETLHSRFPELAGVRLGLAQAVVVSENSGGSSELTQNPTGLQRTSTPTEFKSNQLTSQSLQRSKFDIEQVDGSTAKMIAPPTELGSSSPARAGISPRESTGSATRMTGTTKITELSAELVVTSATQEPSLLPLVHEQILLLMDAIERGRQSLGSDILKRVLEYVDQHYAEEITLQDVAGIAYLNASYFSEKFKELTGENFSTYLTRVRIDKAKEFLQDGRVKVYEVAQRVGYTDQAYFSRVFKKQVGYNPAEYRRRLGIS